MNKIFLDEFIAQIEGLSKSCGKDDSVIDRYGVHQKADVLKSYVSAAKDLVKYGEYLIALENILDNLAESSILLDEKVINLARQAFGEKITKEYELLLEKFTK